MRIGASGFVFLLCVGSAANAAAPRLRIDLPAGPLSAALDTLAEESGANIGSADLALMAIPLPPLHLQGSPAELLASLTRRAGVVAVRTGPAGWQITRRRSPPVQQGVTSSVPSVAIIVQATKRAERLVDYPAEIARTTGADLGAYGAVPDAGALTARVPILTSTDWGAGREKLFLRGIADSSFAGSRPALVGEYLGDQSLTSSAPDPDLRLYDVVSVEVLAGPQGTLYGAGALGGLIRIEPHAPVLDDIAGSAWLGVSHTAHGASGGDIGGVINLPMVKDRLALRAVGYVADDPGYIDDVGRGLKNVNRVDTRGGRATLRWAFAEGWAADLGGVAQRIDNRDAPYGDVPGPSLTRSSVLAQPTYDLLLAGRLVVAGRIGGIDFRSTTGIVHQSLGERFTALQLGSVPALFDEQQRSTLVSQETRLSGSGANMNWVVGASYTETEEREARDFGRFDGPSPIGSLHDRTRDLTGYGEATRKLGGGFSATLGARYAWVHQAGEGTGGASPFFTLRTINSVRVSTNASGTEHHVVPSAALSYQLAQGTMLFTRFERGYRPGGLTLGSRVEHFTSDRIDTWEVGMRRGATGQDRVALSLTGAFSRWRHIQAELLDNIGLAQIANIGDGRVYSIDASLTVRIVKGLELNASGFLARSRLDPTSMLAEDGDAGILPDVARNGGTVALDYRGRLANGRSWQAGMRVQHIGPSLLGIGPQLSRPQGDYTTVALGGSVSFGAVDLTLNISNLLDSRAPAFAVGSPLAAQTDRDVTPLRPRTLRLGARYDF